MTGRTRNSGEFYYGVCWRHVENRSRNAGVKQSILVRSGYGAELEQAEPELAGRATVVDDVAGAVDWILEQS